MSIQSEFIQKIKDKAIEGWSIGKILPSLTIAQAILESDCGRSPLAVRSNNLFGIKASKDWTGKSVVHNTAEYANGTDEYRINASFRAYDSWEESIDDHSRFFHTPAWREVNYAKVIGETDYKKACKAIQDAGYATSNKYTKQLIDIIERYNLTEFDKGISVSSTDKPKVEIDDKAIEPKLKDWEFDLLVYSNEYDEVAAKMITKNTFIPCMSYLDYSQTKLKYQKVLHIGGFRHGEVPKGMQVLAGIDRDHTIDLCQEFYKEYKQKMKGAV